jgi:8-oxo-dGTP pyrophosphatase MutT (NUDIX family)
VKRLSCGILVLNPQRELLLCHATGTFVWDIPKGGAEVGEAPLQTAIRETAEETGLRFVPEDLLELGCFEYRPAKDLHLFAALVDRVDPGGLRCHSHFVDVWGRRRPEMDAYRWTTFERVPRRCTPRMGRLLTQTLSLPQLLQQLTERADAQPAPSPPPPRARAP